MTIRPAALLVVVLALAGCGGDDDTVETEDPAPENTAATTTTADPDPDPEIASATQAFAEALFDWDGATIDEDFDEILALATGQFAVEADATFADEATRDSLREIQAGSRLTDAEVHIESVDGDHAQVFLTAEVVVANEEIQTPRTDTIRAEIGLALVDGEWLVEDLTVLDGLSLGLPR